MKRYTVNLSRARATSRKKRAGKAIKILKEEIENSEGPVTLSSQVNQEIWSRGAAKPPSKISVRVEEEEGEKKVYPGGERRKEGQQERREEPNYESIVSGTVSGAKDAIEELDDPDYNALLEAEQDGKDRKTLIEWIESRSD